MKNLFSNLNIYVKYIKNFMKYVKNYTQFNEELNLRKAAVIGGIAAGMAFGNPTMGQNQTGLPVEDQIEQTEVKGVVTSITLIQNDFNTNRIFTLDQFPNGNSLEILKNNVNGACYVYDSENNQIGVLSPTFTTGAITSDTTFYVSNVSQIITINIFVTTTSINDIESDNSNFSIYPNPATDVINVKSDISGNYQIIDINGKILVNTTDKSININELSPGQYFLRVGNSTQPFIKN